ncbi:hypothetical protein LCGC14_1473050 [marine sediment metagenome]|uniref:Uncharacterized protein n=1 Tax=marine sediment metagenome TaxID=412755 RepID=A0A0F9JBP5_9ZZZZ
MERSYQLRDKVIVKEFGVEGVVSQFCREFDTGRPTYEITFPETQWLDGFCTKVWHCGEDGLEKVNNPY